MAVLACLTAGGNCAFAQSDSVYVDDSVEYMPLRKFDFGTPNPYADGSEEEQPVDFLKTASSEVILRSFEESDRAMRSDVPVLRASSESGTQYSVGQISYQEDVTPYGARIYNVPVMTSPSSRFAPQISLQYNSQAGNGLAGYGWNIGGLSSITMTNKNLYYHGETAPANVSDTDAAYSLDGVPLVRNDDASLATEYPLGTARGHIIVKKHMSGNVIGYFTALYPDGSKVTFGMTSNTTAKSVYPVTLWEDRLGNQIIYSYSYSNNEYRISTIRYKHKNNSTDAGRLTFSYLARQDWHTRYRAGQATSQNYLLRSITSESGGVTLCKYELVHASKDGVSLLTSIKCANASGEQLRPLNFYYGNRSGYTVPPGSDDFSKTDYLFLATYFSSSSGVEFLYNRGKYVPDSYSDGLMVLPRFSIYDVVATKRSGIFNNKIHK